MMNIQIENNIVKVNGFEGYFDSVEIVDDNFVHITVGGMVLGITPSDTTINNESFESVELFADKLNSLKTN
jgi:hypothetical protein